VVRQRLHPGGRAYVFVFHRDPQAAPSVRTGGEGMLQPSLKGRIVDGGQMQQGFTPPVLWTGLNDNVAE
jgi:hypothetical protein